MAIVTAYRFDNGDRVQVPEHWLDHKTLGRPFRKTPPPTKTRATVTEKAPAAGDNQKKEH